MSELDARDDFALLKTKEDYVKYFEMLERAFKLLITWYHEKVEGAGDEEVVVSGFLDRLLYTIKLFAIKSANAAEPTMRLDLKESGYPHLIGVLGIETDLRLREETLGKFDSEPIIRQAMLTHMFELKTDPMDLVASLALRRYYELLDPEKIIMPFTPGELLLKSEDDEMRHYVYSWCCYDVNTNVPYVYIMLFDHDKDEDPLQHEGMQRTRFLDVVHSEGSRVPPLDTVAVSIDNAIEAVHPKILKRIKLGPIQSVGFSREDEDYILGRLREFGKDGDFVMHVRDEMVFSTRQVERRKAGLFSTRSVREIFAIEKSDMECAEAGVSCIHRMLLMPHHLVQRLDMDHEQIKKHTRKVVYTSKGELNAI